MGTPTLPNIDLIKSAFDTANNDLVVAAKANRVTTPDTAAAARPIAQWGNLVDNLLRKFQLRAARSGRSVLEHGAVGDGTTSDATAFQDAIDAVDADGGGKVLVPPPPTGYVIGTPTLRSGVRLHYTDSGDPNGKAYGTDGDRYTRTDGAVTEYVKTGGAGTSSWTDMAAAAAPDLETVLASGNTVDDTQSIDYVDDFDVVRAKSDYDVASGLQRLRTFTSGAVLSATLAIATATGLLTYDGPVELSGTLGAPAALDLVINPGSDAGKQLVLDGLRWPEADGTANQVLATDGAANLIWKTDFASAAGTVAGSMLIWGGSAWVENTSIIAQPDGRLAVAGGATADAAPNSGDLVVGDLSGTVGMSLLIGTAAEGRFSVTDVSGVRRGDLRYSDSGQKWIMGMAGVDRYHWTTTKFTGIIDNDKALGTLTERWSDFHAMQATIYGTTTLSGTGANLVVQGTGTSTFAGVLTAAARVDIGSPTAGGTAGLRVREGSGRVLFMDQIADSTGKSFRLGLPHYDSGTHGSITAIYMASNATQSIANIGGGTATFKAATDIQFWTAADNTTATGTLRTQVDSAGLLSHFGDMTVTGLITANGGISIEGGTGLLFDLDDAYNIGATTVRPARLFTNGIAGNTNRQTTTYTAGASDFYLQLESASAVTTLPDAGSVGAGVVYLIEVLIAHTTGSLKNSAGDTINGNDKSSTGVALAIGEYVAVSDGITDWRLHGPITAVDTSS